MIERRKFPISVLIVDDEPSIIEQLSLILSRRVDVLFTASNGSQGYECYQRQSPDLIISDIDMPVMNGIEFLKLVRAHNRHVPFILSTGLKNLDVLIEAIEQGITAFLPKPLQIKTLLAKLEEAAHTKELKQEVTNSTILLDQYKKIVDDSVIVSKADTNGTITYVNDMFCAISGYTREELVGQPHNIVRDPAMPSSIYKELWETIQAKKIWHGIIHNQAKDGSRYTVKSTIAPILDNEGSIIEYIGLREDITELHKAQEDAMLAAKIKGDFLANMSHEIRTPMNGILGFTDLLSRSSLNEEQKRYLGIISNSTRTLLGIVNDILDFSKIESGKFELDCTQINPFVEFANMAELFTPRMGEKHITFEVIIDPLMDTEIVIDLLRVQQVVSNLLSNAAKFTSENGHVTFYAVYQNETQIRIGVKDNGIGISPSQQINIFEAFSQADNSTTRQFGGTGLGLTISAKLVSIMGGILKVESQAGLGSHFYFDLDLKTCNVPQKVMMPPQKLFRQFTGKVLLAEDNEVNQMLIEEYLNRYHLDFLIVENGQEAIAELQSNSYDLVLMDINMPVLSGLDAAAKIKEFGISTPLIAMTANAMAGDEQKFLESGFNGYLSKPINIEKLETILETYLLCTQNHDAILEKTEPSDPNVIVNMPLLEQELALPEPIIHKLLLSFLSSSNSSLVELKAAVDQSDFKKIENITHRIRGSAGNMRFYSVEKIAGEMEALAHYEKEGDYKELYHRFEGLMKTVDEEIESILNINPKGDHESMV